MADNISILDKDKNIALLATKDIGGVQFAKRITYDSSGAEVLHATSTLQTSANTKLDTLHSDLLVIEGYVDGIETLIGLTNTALGTLNGSFKAEDAAHVSGDLGLQMLTVRKDTAVATAGADGDYQPLTTGADGRLHVRGYSNVVVDTPAITAGGYTAGDVVGGYRTVTLAQANDVPFYITGIMIACKATITPNIRMVFFGATPGATLNDNDAYTLSTTDLLKTRKTLSSLTLGAQWVAHGATVKSLYLADKPFLINPISGGQTIGYYLIDDSASTYASTSDIQVTFFVQGT